MMEIDQAEFARRSVLMPLIIYLDEAGDHSLQADDKDFPIFVLVMVVCDFSVYASQIVPAVFQLKMDYWGHESIILHSRDIRRCKNDFSFLIKAEVRPEFHERINKIMRFHEYSVVPVIIKKNEHKAICGSNPENPYDLALKLALEGVLPLIENAAQKDVMIIAEARGRREDAELRESFHKILIQGTDTIPAERFQMTKFKIHFVEKKMNVVGTQLADLAAYPIGRAVLDSTKPNQPYEIIKQKFYKGNGWPDGIKIFP